MAPIDGEFCIFAVRRCGESEKTQKKEDVDAARELLSCNASMGTGMARTGMQSWHWDAELALGCRMRTWVQSWHWGAITDTENENNPKYLRI